MAAASSSPAPWTYPTWRAEDTARVVPYSELYSTFVACGQPVASAHRTLAAAVIVATHTRAASSRLRFRQQSGRAIEASLRDRPTSPPPSLGGSLLARAESSDSRAQQIDRAHRVILRRAALFRWRSAATQRDTVLVDAHRLHTFLPWRRLANCLERHSWPVQPTPTSAASSPTCPLSSAGSGWVSIVGPVSASGKITPSVGVATPPFLSVIMAKCWKLVLAPVHADIKIGPKPVGAECGRQVATKSQAKASLVRTTRTLRGTVTAP